MPNIPEYNAPQNLGLNPTEIGADATAAAARRINSAYNQAGQGMESTGQRLGSAIGGAIATAGKAYVDYEDHKEISHGAAVGADVVASLNQDWNDTAKNADPNDPSVAAKWRAEKLEPALEQFAGGFTTEKSQAWAERFVDQYREHVANKTSADMSSLAADAVHLNTVTTINKLSSAVYNDPSSLGFAVDSLDHSVGGIVGSSPNLTPDVAGRVKADVSLKGKEQIVKSAVAGAIANGGDWQKIANDPKYSGLINGAELQQFAKAAKTQERADLLQQKQIEVMQRQLDELNVKKASNKSFSDNVQFDESTGRPIIDPKYGKDAVDLPRKFPDAPNAADHARTNLDWMEGQQKRGKEVIQNDPAVLNPLLDRAFDPANPLTLKDLQKAQVDSIRTGRGLDDSTFKKLKDIIDDRSPQTAALASARKDFFTDFAATIDPGRDASTGAGGSALGSQKLFAAKMEAIRQEQFLQSKGQDPHSLYDPKSPNFFGNQVSQFRPTLQEKAAFDAKLKSDQAQAVKPGANLGTITGIDVKDAPAHKLGDRQQFKQGWGVWNGTTFVPEKP